MAGSTEVLENSTEPNRSLVGSGIMAGGGSTVLDVRDWHKIEVPHGSIKFDSPSKGHDLKDSGERREFTTGALRDRQKGKGRFSLVPNWVIWLVSRVYEDGSYKYSARNWEKGMPLSEYVCSAENHLAKLKAGMRDEPHASQVIWNMIGYVFTGWLIQIGKRPKELNDMPDQLAEAGKVADPLSPYEYDALSNFFGMNKGVV